ncbi:MAG: helix-turn-helix domain-containing protein [Pseudomonas sp.]|uniref:helix-turn-helix domain-containing protein n=1 Tax=Pseudomonas sp. TaxID=306 RepID=UPI0027342461|nr:helix-turn-helix domain-containing protein [Pseudomonas sp.]MDP3845523.1 helix-turn-helix domain-containing protein [Pseudomonas sp.]
MHAQISPPISAAIQHQRAAADVILNPADLLTPEQAALVLGLSDKTLATWRSTGRYALPFLRCGARIRYRRDDLANWLQGRLSTSTANAVKGAA